MKKILFVIGSFLSLTAMAQVKMPAPSPAQTLTQEFGLGKIEIVYSRPSLKGRPVFGAGSLLAPIGDVWRTGANGATKLTFSDPVNIGNKTIPAGSYGLFTIPGASEWTIIINTNSKSWGSFDYKEAEDVVRFKVAPETTGSTTETFTIGIDAITAQTATIYLKWGKTKVNIPISTDIRPAVRAQIDAATAAATVNPNVYQSAATFYLELDHDYNKALVFADKAIAANAKAYWLHLLKARIHVALNDKKGAKASAETCKQMATEAKNMDYVRSADEILKSL
ncbi:MAG: DUF2911 domain-containing protein [Chitinophagaceae bacterium]|nr:DUF2911 domain-containing protein [Chitinophagaceae bacterium]